jgi:hypothetical protein
LFTKCQKPDFKMRATNNVYGFLMGEGGKFKSFLF